jgi:hypothetical protein
MTDEIIKFGGVIIAATLTVAVGLLLYFLKKKDDEVNLIKNKISDEKYKTYFDIISLFFDILKENKGLSSNSQNDLAIRYIDIKKNLLLLGSDEVIRKYTQFDKSMVEYSDYKDNSKIGYWLELFILIRKDSGNPKTELTVDDLLKSISATEKDYNDIRALMSQRNKGYLKK